MAKKTRRPKPIHVYPVDKVTGQTSHFTDGKIPCWCNPETKQVCSESDDDGHCVDNCWRCGGSALVDPYNDLNCNLIVHTVGEDPCYPDLDDSDLDAK